ncbi:MAG: beta-lactamase family protein, partial [Ignavibacteria bacterium]|nr:beta-lactamase family protein [Ignavibacteria bacterium]
MIEDKLQRILIKTIDNKKVFGTAVSISTDSFSWTGSAGNLDENSQFFIGSTTKLFTASVIFMLKSQRLLSLDDRISEYVSSELVHGLHIYKGIDYSNNITIENLLAHTSGLPDYFQQKQKNGRSLFEEIISGKDRLWNFEDVIELSKSMSPKFIPGEKRKAFYSDTNYQILGRIIEIVLSKQLKDVYNELIIKPLGIENTYLFDYLSDTKPRPIYYKNKPLE